MKNTTQLWKKKKKTETETYAQIKTYKKYKNSTLKSHDKYHFINKTFNNAQ